MDKEEIKQSIEAAQAAQAESDAAMKKAEADWRKSMATDTAGHVLEVTRALTSQIGAVQAQLDMLHPEAQLARAVGVLSEDFNALDERLKKLEAALQPQVKQ